MKDNINAFELMNKQYSHYIFNNTEYTNPFYEKVNTYINKAIYRNSFITLKHIYTNNIYPFSKPFNAINTLTENHFIYAMLSVLRNNSSNKRNIKNIDNVLRYAINNNIKLDSNIIKIITKCNPEYDREYNKLKRYFLEAAPKEYRMKIQ